MSFESDELKREIVLKKMKNLTNACDRMWNKKRSK